ncbi:MAG TPA: histidine--tRNA ligase [Candidatus Dojkabacteria bacterium]|nr:histidine--tRNA ligase [Candidatus Dojkabacteria bacterium]
MKEVKLSTQPYKGTQDYYPEDMFKRDYLFNIWRSTAKEFSYQEYDTPILENAEIYRAKSGDELANTQLYNFVDKGGREVAIRPEMTPSLARIIAAKYQQLPKPIRWFSIDKFYRYEKPQRGRSREFFQLNIDIFGIETIEAEIEIFQYINQVMEKLNAPKESWRVYVNNRLLMDYVFKKILKLSDEQIPKVARAIDNYTKVNKDEYPNYLEQVGLDKLQVVKLLDFLEKDITSIEALASESQGATQLVKLFKLCKELDLDNFEFKPYIMRGITYYTGTVIEMFDVGGDKNPRAMFGGGRYDDLLEIFGKDKLPAFGIGWGNVTMMDYLETYDLLPKYNEEVDVFVSTTSENEFSKSSQIAQALRAIGLKTEQQLKVDSLKKQLSLASKKGVRYVAFKGEKEWVVKDMRDGIQKEVSIETIADYFKGL